MKNQYEFQNSIERFQTKTERSLDTLTTMSKRLLPPNGRPPILEDPVGSPKAQWIVGEDVGGVNLGTASVNCNEIGPNPNPERSETARTESVGARLHISEHRLATIPYSESEEQRKRILENLRNIGEMLQEMLKVSYGTEVWASTKSVCDKMEAEWIKRDETEHTQVEVIASPVEEIADKNQEIKPLLKSDVDSIDGDDEPFSNESTTTEEIATPIKDVYQETDQIVKALRLPIQCESSGAEGLQPSNPENEDSLRDLQRVNDNSEVNLKHYNVENFDNVPNELVELVNLLIEWIEIRLVNSSTNPVGCLGNFIACKVFVEIPSLIRTDCCLDFDCFEPKSVSFGMTTRNWPYDRGKFDVGKRGMWTAMAKVGHSLVDRYFVLELVGRVFDNFISFMSDATLEIGGLSFVFDPGGSDRDWMQTFGMRLVFDPGGVIACLVEVKVDDRPRLSGELLINYVRVIGLAILKVVALQGESSQAAADG